MATYYTSSTALGGGAGSYSDAFTLQEAFDTAVAGDEVRVLNDGTYYPTSRIDVDTNQGTATSAIVFTGRNSGDTAEEVATISATSLTSGNVIYFDFGNANHSFLNIKNLKFDGNVSGSPIVGANSFNNRGVHWFNCIFTNSDHYAFGNGGYFNSLTRCQFIDNASLALFSFKNGQVHGCYFEGSGTSQYANTVFASTSIFYGCVFRNCGNHYSDMTGFFNCTFDGNGNQAKAIASGVTVNTPIVNCVFANYTTQAIEGGSSNAGISKVIQGCYFYNNASDTDFTIDSTNTLGGADPQFPTTTNGTEDYTPQTGSPLIGAGQPSLIPNSSASDKTSKPTIGAITAAIAAAALTFPATPPPAPWIPSDILPPAAPPGCEP